MADALAIDRTDLEAIAEVERQTSWRSNERDPKRRGRRFGSFGVSVNMTHAKVAREPAEPKKPAKAPAPAAPVEAPPIATPRPSVGGFIKSYSDMVQLVRDRADLLEISRLEIDRISGIQDGHSGHLFSRRFTKIFGMKTLMPVLETLGLRLLVVEDPEWTARTLKLRAPRNSSHVHYAPDLPALPAPLVPDPSP
jgi:hypothetical protein